MPMQTIWSNGGFVGTRRRTLNLVRAACLLLFVQVFLQPAGPLSAGEAGGDLPSLSYGTHLSEPATARYYHGDRDGALAILQRLYAHHPGDLDVALNYARLLREAGRLEQAVEVYEELHRLLKAHRDRAYAEHGTGTVAPAFEYTDTLHIVMTELGRSRVLLGDHATAAAQLEESLHTAGEPEGNPYPEVLFWYGTALLELGRNEEAQAVLERLIGVDAHQPQARLQLAGARLALGSYEEAVREYETALRLDPNLSSALLPLAQSYLSLGRVDTAYRLLQRAELSLPWNEQIREKRRLLEEEHPELSATRAAELAERTATTRAPLVTALGEERERIPNVRIGLAEEVAVVQARSGGRWVLEELHNGVVVGMLSGESEELFTVRVSNSNGVELLNEQDELLFRTTHALRIRYDEAERSTVLFDIEFGHGQFSAGREDRSYRGEIEFFRRGSGMTVVNTVNLEEYLYSVVPSEMPAHWPEAALEAQAVAARSYTIAGMNGRFRERGFDLLSSVASHYYRGIRGEHPRTTAAVNATRGQVLMAGNAVLNAVYSANTAGYTESSASVWGSTTALVGVSDLLLPNRSKPESPESLMRWLLSTPESYSNVPGLSSRSAYRWSIWVHRDDILHRNSSAGLGSVAAVTPLARGNSGRVESVLITGTDGAEVVRRDAVRSRLGGLRSNLFMVEPKLDSEGKAEYFIFSGAGWGHGVGMCQTGAAGMASHGFTAEEILLHYYPKAQLTVRY